MKKLRIAQFATSGYSFPMPAKIKQLCAPMTLAGQISKILTESGNDVTFFGPKGTKSKYFHVKELDFIPFNTNPLVNNYLTPEVKGRISGFYAQFSVCQILLEHQKKSFDIIHIHKVDRALPLAYLFPDINFVYTIHDPIYPWWAEMYRLFQTPNQHLVTISNAQRKTALDLKYFATVYNGIDLKFFPFSKQSKEYLLFIGRLFPPKGVNEAIQTAIKTKKQLQIIGPIEDPDYWKTKIKPYLGDRIKLINFIDRNKLYHYYRQAKVFLMPIMWEEPFGLVMIEAMACGTPVVAFNRGSVPEVIKDGVTGFIVKPGDVKAMTKAVQRIYDMPEEDYQKMRLACRKHVEDNFTVEKMVDSYEKVYYQIVEESQKRKK